MAAAFDAVVPVDSVSEPPETVTVPPPEVMAGCQMLVVSRVLPSNGSDIIEPSKLVVLRRPSAVTVARLALVRLVNATLAEAMSICPCTAARSGAWCPRGSDTQAPSQHPARGRQSARSPHRACRSGRGPDGSCAGRIAARCNDAPAPAWIDHPRASATAYRMLEYRVGRCVPRGLRTYESCDCRGRKCLSGFSSQISSGSKSSSLDIIACLTLNHEIEACSALICISNG